MIYGFLEKKLVIDFKGINTNHRQVEEENKEKFLLPSFSKDADDH